ncbi:MAG: TonB-dependent receptor [Lysobacterales bacterium]|jgi:TonB-dependent receptor
MQKTSFQRTPLARSVAVALSTIALSQAAFAQDSQDADSGILEEVVVTSSIRGSLMASMDRKRNANGVVDAITAEDMGKFPDTNLAEALQRIPGVSIDRSNGEGSQITVRGMGPEFNLVTLNGRQMPSAGSRSFDFGDIATEGVSAVEIYKTAKAGLPTGGIGATVNMITTRPLDAPGFKSVLSVKGVHESSASDGAGDSFTPEVAGVFSNTFADDTFGILISGSFQERNNREEQASVDSWIPNRPVGASAVVQDNNQRADGITWSPQNAGYGWADIVRERTNGQLVLQYAPTDRFTATLDYTYTEVDFEKDSNSYGIWFNAGDAMQSATINERGTFTQVSEGGGDYATGIGRDHTIKENKSLGLNLAWQATDSVSFELDMHDSSSEIRGGGLGSLPGSSANLIIGNTFCDWCGFVPGVEPSTATIGTKTATYGPGGIPIWDASFISTATGLAQSELLNSDIGSLFGQAFDTDVNNDITQVQLNGKWENLGGGAVTSINFGVSSTDQDFRSRDAYSGQLPAGFWLTSATHWPDDIWQRGSTAGLDGFSNGGSFAIPYYYTLGFDAVVDGYETLGANDCCIAGLYWPGWGPNFQDDGRGRFWSGPISGDAIVGEKVTSFYTEMVLQDEFNGMPVNVVAGLRYQETDVESQGLETPATDIIWVGGSEFIYEYANESTFSNGSSTTNQFLPSLDVDMEVKDDVITRFSFSRSLARPPIGALNSTRTFEGNPKINNRKVSVGNPGLVPYLSDNFDLSVEWYYDEGSYVSVGYFKKIVDNFLISSTTQGTFAGLLDPYAGPRALEARAQLEAEGIVATDSALFTRINENLGVDPTTAIRPVAGDPLAVFDITSTTNAQEANIFGWEFAVQHLFGDSGWGLVANATVVNGDVDANRDVVDLQFALPGLSDSANLSVFYENDRLSARVAYNWRDEFLSGFDQHSSPIFNEEYSQIDANFSWLASDNLTLFVEALNITEEVQRVFVRYSDQFLRGNQYGARYNIGARYSF